MVYYHNLENSDEQIAKIKSLKRQVVKELQVWVIDF